MKAFDWIKKAHSEKFAIGAFNVANLETFKAVTNAASKLKSPVILEASDGEVNFIGYKQIVALARAYEDTLGIPIILNLDHGKNFESAKKAIEAGFDYIHIDGSQMPYEENVAQTAETVKLAHKYGLPVEGEMDHIQGSSADHRSETAESIQDPKLYTNPEKAKDFIARTGIDVFASFIGNLHGYYASTKHLNLGILSQLRTVLPNTYFSLHGGSGIFDQDVKDAIQIGIVKVNINSEMRIAFKMTLQEEISKTDEIAVYKLMEKPINEVQKVVEYKMKMFGSVNRVA